MRNDRRNFLGLTLAAGAQLAFGADRARAAGTGIAMQASWVNDAEFLGYFVALETGFYKAQSLPVTYIPGGPDVIPESALLGAKADLALTTPDTTLKAIADDSAPFRIIGAQFQKNPLGVVSLARSGIKTPADLVGKTLAVPPVNTLSVNAMLRMNKIDPASVKVVPYEYDPTPLLKGSVDATVDFVTDVPFTLKQQGAAVSSFLLYDHGFTIYNDTVAVTLDTLKTKRKELVAWLRASRAGWDENFKDPTAWPPKFKDSWFKGTGRTTENDIFTNTADKPLMVHPRGIFTMTDEDIVKNIAALAATGIKVKRESFDTSLLAEI